MHRGHEDIDHSPVLLEVLFEILGLHIIQQTTNKNLGPGERWESTTTASTSTSDSACFLCRYLLVLRLDIETSSVQAVLHGHYPLVERLVAVQHETKAAGSDTYITGLINRKAGNRSRCMASRQICTSLLHVSSRTAHVHVGYDEHCSRCKYSTRILA